MSGMTLLLPSHAYIPGKNPRHDGDAFSAVRQTAAARLGIADLAASDAFQAGLLFIDKGYYWEAHEVLEAVWLALPPASSERQLVQALIQFANARLKLVMGRKSAAGRLAAIAARHLAEAALAGHPRLMGVELAGWEKRVTGLEHMIKAAL